MTPKPTKDNTAWCPRCGDELRIMQAKLKPSEQWTYQCGSCEKYFELTQVNASQEEVGKFLWNLRDKEVYGVIRAEVNAREFPELEDNEYTLEEIENYEFSDEDTARFEAKLRELEGIGELGHTQYVGNAYYVETSTENRMHELWNILIQDAKSLPKHAEITLELNYCPEWAEVEENDEN